MIRLRRALEVFQVAAHTSRIRVSQVVVIVDVALCALHGCVRPGQRESSSRVIEGGAGPRRGAMALLASLREAGADVVRIRGALEIFQVAAHAGSVGAGQVVVAIYVALCALHAGVRPGQRESSGRMVEIRAHPCSRGVALLASLREARLHVIRIGRALEIFQMAADASRICARQVVVIVDVATRAGNRCVRSGQRKSGGGVVKGRAIPRSRGVTLLASLRKSGTDVVRIGRALKIFQVAADAGRVRAGQVVVAVHVALSALHAGVRAGQGESCGRMIKVCAGPGSRVMALRTGLRECGLHVVRIRGCLEILQVATDARRIRGGQVVVAIHVALHALHSRVGSAQREASGGVIKRRVVPRSRGVALLATGREP